MGNSKSRSKLYSFYKAVVTVIAFAACFYLFAVCFVATYRLISDLGSVRVLFLNPILMLLIAFAAVFAAGIFILKSEKTMGRLSKLENADTYSKAMRILKAVIFIESVLFVISINGVRQNVDQLSVQQAAYSFSWGETEAFTPPGYLGIYPNNIGMAVIHYLLSLVAGHYNNTLIMLINAILVPFIYSDLAEIGGRFGLSKKGRILVMAAGALFLPLQAKSVIIYGDVPGMFFAVRAMRLAAETSEKKISVKKTAALIAFPAIACLLKNNFIIFAIAVMIYLAAEFLRQKRFKELYIPVAVIACSVLINAALNLAVGAVIGHAVSEGASKWSWIAMGMQEEAGIYNGYNASTYAASGFDQAVQSAAAKESIKQSLSEFTGEPNYGIGFYTRKVLIQWSDPTHCGFEFPSRNVYLDGNASPLAWLLASPFVISAAASCLKLYQVLMFLGSAAFAVTSGRKKQGSPALLLFLTFVGGYVFHLIWEAAPFYTMSYMVMLIPVGTAGIISMMKKLSKTTLKELQNARFTIDSGIIYFIAGTLVFLFAAAGLGTVRKQLVDGMKEYKAYYNETLSQSRNPVPEGKYHLMSADPACENNVDVKVELVRYAGRYRMRLLQDGEGDNVYLTAQNNSIGVSWFSNDESQVFVILRNKNGTYTICRGADRAFFIDGGNSMIKLANFMNYPFQFNTEDYDDLIKEKPGFTWKLVPAS
ncbi:MAG: hypothetical protein K6E60_02225 [Saccharofermentans sp.]|nr:hypothetical protein [Saccharofermentans sp.]